jgi:hypothetical protein
MGKHTPGPWSVFRRDGYSTYIHAINEGDEINTFQVASCYCATSRKYFPTRDEAEANARLIAAAPELLEALKDAADAIEHWGAYVPEYFQSKHDLEADIDRARDTIAKVEGRP